ncbi:MAG: hypothetical protein BGN88_14150, partial [Clostridiales bacterium 43-6]
MKDITYRRITATVFGTLMVFAMLAFILYERPAVIKTKTAVGGVLDLTGVRLSENKVVMLNGEWEFYQDKLLSPEDFKNPSVKEKMTGYISVPGKWSGEINGTELSARGQATYRLTIQLGRQNAIYGIKTENIRYQSTLFLNDTQLLANGRFAIPDKERLPAGTPETGYITVNGNTLTIVMQVVNDVHNTGGVYQPVYFGNQYAITTLHAAGINRDTLIVVTLFVVALMHFMVYMAMRMKKRNEPILLLFAINFVLFAVSNSIYGEKLLLQTFSFLSFDLLYKVSMVSTYGSLLVDALFLMLLGKNVVPKRFANGAVIIFGLFITVILIAPLKVNTLLQSYYAVFGEGFLFMIPLLLGRAIHKKQYGVLGKRSLRILIITFVFGSCYGIGISLYTFTMLTAYKFAVLSGAVYVLLLAFLLSDKFSQAFHDNEHLTERLLAMDTLKDEFLANTSHELKTPLNGIINITQSLHEKISDQISENQRQQLELLVIVGKRLSALIDDILDFEKLKRKEIKLDKAIVEVKTNVSLVLEMLKYSKRSDQVTVENCLPDTLPPAYADQNRLKQIMYNIVGNAIKFTHTGNVTVDGYAEKGSITIRVTDTGIGIPQEKQEEIFEPFVQAQSAAHSSYGGTGLGLSVSRQLAVLMGGTLTLEYSVEGKGSCFVFTVPIYDGKEKTASVPLVSDGEEWYHAAPGNNPSIIKGQEAKILVVDDEPLNQNILLNILEEENCDILTVSDGKTALRMIETEGSFDLVLLDIMMPEMSGFEVCREIRKQYSLLELPVLFITARNMKSDFKAGFDVGANDFITKPIDAGELRARVRTLLLLKKSLATAINSEMAFLQAQIKPHFLYNTLNTIMNLCYKDGETAGRLLGRLSEYLQKSFDIENTTDKVTLERELELTKAYTEIEQARFGNRLYVVYDVYQSLMYKTILPLTIQPIVENAIRHGVLAKEEGGTVQISVYPKEEG